MTAETRVIERPYGPFPEARISTVEQSSRQEGEGYRGHEYVRKTDGLPFSALCVTTTGKKPESKVEGWHKAYLVTDGEGTFGLNGKFFDVQYGHFISIPPGNRYSYRARGMRMFEFNTLAGYLGPFPDPQIITLDEIKSDSARMIPRTGFTGYMYIRNEDGYPYNAIYVEVKGASGKNEMTGAWRNYLCLEGNGSATINGVTQPFRPGGLLTIPPNNTYEYRGFMNLFEFNTPPSFPGTYRKVP